MAVLYQGSRFSTLLQGIFDEFEVSRVNHTTV